MSVSKQDNGFGDAVLRVVSLQALHAEKSSNCILPFLVHERADVYLKFCSIIPLLPPQASCRFCVREQVLPIQRKRGGGEGAREIKNEMKKDVR